MRVISGTARGLKLKSPEGIITRPTTDRIKESLFNIIAPYIQETIFLDLFSGSGAIGIEALSRGAEKAFFVDSSKKSYELIKQNISSAKFLEKSEIYNIDCLNAIDKFAEKKVCFDIIFMDPPYSQNFVQPILNKIKEKNLLKENGIIICEQHIEDEIPIIEGLNNYRIKEYKTTKMVFFENI
ncbi:MAG: 16S rRNA (guanine(966)-N(2))-methyltransferase RsmD [Eubacteriales bacterium]|nr:16S rRNA (guanine(966)-N(2))-methyltransferase RsmD [Eubacteriales bacterium]